MQLLRLGIFFFVFYSTALQAEIDSAFYYFERSQEEPNIESFKSLSHALLFIENNESSELYVMILNDLSKLSRKSMNFEQAKAYAHRALLHSKILNNNKSLFESYSSLGGVHFNSNLIDSAIFYYQTAKEHIDRNDTIKLATISNNLGVCFRAKGFFQKSIYYFDQASLHFKNIGDLKKETSASFNSIVTKIYLGETENAKNSLDNILDLSSNNNWDDLLFKALNAKLELIAQENKLPEITMLVDSISSLEHIDFVKTLNENNVKYETEIKENENRYLRGISKKQKNIILTLFTSFILLIIGAFFYLRNQRLKNELREANLIISKQKALQTERTRIAAEMHDDLGGGLTTIKFLSQKVYRKSDDEGIKSQVKKIVNQSETLVNNMSEIIWAMNAGFDTLASLISYTRRYAHEYLETHGIELEFRVIGASKKYKLSGNERRNIFLVIKEVLHNSIKHANCQKVKLNFEIDSDLKIVLRDNGKGLDSSNELGNGLKNIKSRMEGIGGAVIFKNDGGFVVELLFPKLKEIES